MVMVMGGEWQGPIHVSSSNTHRTSRGPSSSSSGIRSIDSISDSIG